MNEQNLEDHNNKTIIVDICIDNCNIRASKPADRFQNNPMPTDNEVQRYMVGICLQGIFCLSDSPLSR
jgi:hypothetical protein